MVGGGGGDGLRMPDTQGVSVLQFSKGTKTMNSIFELH